MTQVLVQDINHNNFSQYFIKLTSDGLVRITFFLGSSGSYVKKFINTLRRLNQGRIKSYSCNIKLFYIKKLNKKPHKKHTKNKQKSIPEKCHQG